MNRKLTRRPNTLAHVRDFIDAWYVNTSRRNAPLLRSQFGNINDTGLPGDVHGSILTSGDPRFERALEGGIRELVLLLTSDFGLITYTSCEGHHYAGTAITPAERHVGILPRNPSEYERVRQILAAAITHGGDLLVSAQVECVTLEHYLIDSAIRGISFPVIDMYLARRSTWTSYFDDLPKVYESLVASIKATST